MPYILGYLIEKLSHKVGQLELHHQIMFTSSLVSSMKSDVLPWVLALSSSLTPCFIFLLLH